MWMPKSCDDVALDDMTELNILMHWYQVMNNVNMLHDEYLFNAWHVIYITFNLLIEAL